MDRKRRSVSAGTVFMLFLVVLVLGGSAWVLTRLSGGRNVDLNRVVTSVMKLSSGEKQEIENIRIQQEPGEKPAEPTPTVKPAAGMFPSDAETGTAARTFTLTAGGTAAIETEVRRSCYSNDSKKYDFSDIMIPLKNAVSADLSTFFFENTLSDEFKVSTTIIPTAGADLPVSAGFGTAACGFAKAYDKGQSGIDETRKALENRGIIPLGIRSRDQGEEELFEANGIRISLQQYTGTLTATVKKNMTKDGNEDAVPAADIETIRNGIRSAKEHGADAVVVMIQWGKDGKNVDKKQKELAQQIAEAGADLIIGAGSRIPQETEMLQVAGEDGKNRQVLCAYSLGTLISDNRGNAKRLGSYLLHVTFRKENGAVSIVSMEYTPVYCWRYKQDGRFFYRCVPIGDTVPDGMDAEQQKVMGKALKAVTDALESSPLTAR